MFSVCLFGIGWRVGVRILRLYLLPGCVMGACVCNGSIGCTNNNYASREKCKKCGQLKEVAAMPAVAIPGASVATHPTYFSMAHGGREQMVNVGSLQPSLSLSSSWRLGGADQYGNQYTDPYGLQPTSNWSLGGNNIPGVPYARQINQLPMVPNDNGWRTGDWMCTCGFHNYSSRVQVHLLGSTILLLLFFYIQYILSIRCDNFDSKTYSLLIFQMSTWFHKHGLKVILLTSAKVFYI